MDKNVVYSLLISSFAGISTLLGGLVVYFKFKDKNSFIAFALSFSLSVMISLSIFELLPDSFITLSSRFGLLVGIIFTSVMFLVGKFLVTKINKKLALLQNKDNLYRVGLLSMIALMVHNFPEGIATFMASYNDLSTGISLGIAIMLHNIPEGISIAVPVYYATNKRSRGLMLSLISGIAEPFGAILAYVLLKDYINETLVSVVLMFVAGIMTTLAINEMIPEVNKYNNKRLYTIIIHLYIHLVKQFVHNFKYFVHRTQ